MLDVQPLTLRNLPPIGGAAHAVDDPAGHVSERATLINFAKEPRYCSASYQEAAGAPSSTRKVSGSAPK